MAGGAEPGSEGQRVGSEWTGPGHGGPPLLAMARCWVFKSFFYV